MIANTNTRLERRIRFLFLRLPMVIPQNGRERPDQAGADGFSAKPAEPEGEWHGAPHVRLELHRLQRDLQSASRGAASRRKLRRASSPLMRIVSSPARAPSARSSATRSSRSASGGKGPNRSRSSSRTE
jgi:hypothetical protein